MIVVDGRTDREKLIELLQVPEQTHLEFKSELDLTTKRDELNFVKDAVSMSNRSPGGYILVGVNDDRTLALPIGTIADRARFDGARLGDTIRRYIEGEVHVMSQVHEVDGHEVILIYLPHHRDGLPVPMSKLGQFQEENGKQVVVFREGDVLVREGAKNTPLRHAHWNDLLDRRDQRLREEARTHVDSLIADLATAMRAGGAGPTLVPMSVEMADDAFGEAVASHLEAGSDIRLRQFLGQTAALVSNPDERRTALDKITILTAHAMYLALLQRLAAVRGRLSLCADQAAAAKWWLSMPMASVSAEGPMPKALSTRRTSPLMPGCRHQGRACPLRRARMTSNPLIVA